MLYTSTFIEELKQGFELELKRLEQLLPKAADADKSLLSLLKNQINQLKAEISFLSSDKSALIHENTLKEQKIKNGLKEKFKTMTKGQLEDEAATIVVDLFNMTNFVNYYFLQKNAYASKALDMAIKNIKGNEARRRGKEFTHSIDDERIKECVELLRSSLDRNLEPTDFLSFVSLLKSKYPQPVYVKSPRLTPEEKMLSVEAMAKRLENKFDPNWKQGNLRNKWKHYTGVNASTKRPSPLK